MQVDYRAYTARMGTSSRGARPGLPARDPGQDSIGRLLADWARERPDLDFSPVGVINRLGRVREHIDSALLQVFRDFGLTAADFRVIVTLRRVGSPYELPQARLMTQLALTSGTISLRVDRLAKRGIITREPDPDDKRGQRVRLTAEGLRLFDKIAPLHLANEDRLLSSLTHDERATLAWLLSKLLVSFESGTAQAGLPLGMRLGQHTSPGPGAPPSACPTHPACSSPRPSREHPPRQPGSPAATSSSRWTALSPVARPCWHRP